jgi:hypothetical protein
LSVDTVMPQSSRRSLVARYAVDHTVVLHALREGFELSTEHMLLAPTLVRSQVLEALYEGVGRGELSREVGLERG